MYALTDVPHTMQTESKGIDSMKHYRGYTLIELLVTLSIAVILMTVAIPGLQDFMRASRLSSVAMDQMGALNMARSEAIKRGMTISLCATPMDTDPSDNTCTGGWAGGMMAFIDLNGNGGKDGGETLVKVYGGTPSGYTVSEAGGATVVTFNRMGMSAASRTFNLCASGSTAGQQISVTTTGLRMGSHTCP